MRFTNTVMLFGAALAGVSSAMPVAHNNTLVVRLVDPRCSPVTKAPTKAPTKAKVPAAKAPTKAKVPAAKAPVKAKAPAAKAPVKAKAPVVKAPAKAKAPAVKAPTKAKAPAVKAPKKKGKREVEEVEFEERDVEEFEEEEEAELEEREFEELEARKTVGTSDVGSSFGPSDDLTTSNLVTCYGFAIAGTALGSTPIHILAHLLAADRDTEFAKLQKEVTTFQVTAMTGTMSPPDLNTAPAGFTAGDRTQAAGALTDYTSKFNTLIGGTAHVLPHRMSPPSTMTFTRAGAVNLS